MRAASPSEQLPAAGNLDEAETVQGETVMERTQTAITYAEISRWYAGKPFSSDWTTWHIPEWARILADRRGNADRVLEIGSWEGRSALFFLNYLPACRLTCVDTFQGSAEHQEYDGFTDSLPGIEERFDANVSEFSDRVEKIKDKSAIALPQLGMAERRFDIAYIDGSHYAADVFSDGVLTWSLMSAGGIVIFDDYAWDLMSEECMRPKRGIESFLRTIAGQYRTVHCDYQMIIAKV